MAKNDPNAWIADIKVVPFQEFGKVNGDAGHYSHLIWRNEDSIRKYLRNNEILAGAATYITIVVFGNQTATLWFEESPEEETK